MKKRSLWSTHLLSSMVLLALVAILPAALVPGRAAAQAADPPTSTPIKHFLFLMQENHSFDNYFGTYPGANGIPEGTCIPVDPTDPANAECIRPFRIGDNDVEMDDPDHSDQTHRLQYNAGRMDGFVYALNQRNQEGRLAMGYYDDRELPYHWNIADNFVLFDAFFSSASGGSFINHMYWVAAAPGVAESEAELQAVLAGTPTLFDRLEESGISWKVYVQNYEPRLTYRTLHEFPGNRASQVIWMPLLNFDRFIDDPNLNGKIVDMSEYYADLNHGTLPAIAYLVPSGPSEHPPSSLRSGQRFVRSLIQALMQSQYWEKSAFLYSYDDWGGWYDHVPPPQVDEYGYGFRVPALLVSAYAKKGYIDSTVLDYTSAIKFIQENWGIEPLAERDARANSFMNVFDFTQPPRQPAIIPFERPTNTQQAEPRRSAIFFAYGTALLAALGLAGIAFRPPLQPPHRQEVAAGAQGPGQPENE